MGFDSKRTLGCSINYQPRIDTWLPLRQVKWKFLRKMQNRQQFSDVVHIIIINMGVYLEK